MENYNIELLNKTYLRIVNILEKNSNLTIYIGDIDNIDSDLTEICISRKRSSFHSYSLMFKASLKSTEEDNKYSFLLHHNHKYNNANYISNSIFNFAERCRNYYNKHCLDDYSIAHELYSSNAGKIIKELGFPCCLEELVMKMDLMGI